MRKYGESKTTRIMKTTVPHVTSGSGLRKFQADGFLLDRVYIKSKHAFTFSNSFPKLCRAWGNVETLYAVGQATNDNTLWRMHFACWRAANTLRIYNTSFFVQCNNGYSNAPHCYVIVQCLTCWDVILDDKQYYTAIKEIVKWPLAFSGVKIRLKLPDSRLQFFVNSSVSMNPSQGI